MKWWFVLGIIACFGLSLMLQSSAPSFHPADAATLYGFAALLNVLGWGFVIALIFRALGRERKESGQGRP